MDIDRHPINREAAAAKVLFETELMNDRLQDAHANGELGDLWNVVVRRAQFQSGASGSSPETLRAVADVAVCGAAMFAVARSAGQRLVLPLPGGSTASLHGPVAGSSLSMGSWLVAIWSAIAVGDWASERVLARVPVDLLRQNTPPAAAFRIGLVEALRALRTQPRSVAPHLLRNLRATDPDALDRTVIDSALAIDVPTLDAFHRALSARTEAAEFEDALVKALEHHREYWSSKTRRDNPEGYLSRPVSGLIAWARERGVESNLKSDYLAAGPGADHALSRVCCPYCIEPLNGSAAICPFCLLDTERDARVEESIDEWAGQISEECSACSAPMHPLAVICPECRTRRQRTRT